MIELSGFSKHVEVFLSWLRSTILDREWTEGMILKYWVLLVSIFIFWPVWVNLFIAVATASGWLFWLFTSALLGIVQVGYASYQFIFVLLDIMGLTVLKTFAMLRSQILQLAIFSRFRFNKSKKTNQRRAWRRKISNATSYKEYSNIYVEEPEVQKKDPPRNTRRSTFVFGRGDKRKSLFDWRNSGSLRAAFMRADSDPDHSQAETTNYDKCSQIEAEVEDANFELPTHSNSNIRRRVKRKSKRSPRGVIRRSVSCTVLPQKTTSVDMGNGHHEHPPPLPPRETDMPDSPLKKQQIHSHSEVNLQAESTSASSSSDEEGNQQQRHVSRVEELLGMTGGMLLTTTNRLREARMQAIKEGDASSLKFLLAGVVKRNHLSLDELLIDDARSIAESGRRRLPQEARDVINGFMDEVSECLDWIADSAIVTQPTVSARENPGSFTSSMDQREASELSDRIQLMSKMRMNTGCSALMLSGGGAQAMYHLGTIRALVEAGLYDDIQVISGTSGGSIAAAMCAIATTEELLKNVCVPNVATDYMCAGVMKKQNIRWFPTIWEMGTYWLKHRLLVDSKEFKRCCDHYYGDVTFAEAFRKSGKNVCITVSASRASAGGGAQRLLLNHISTPHVTLSSAVAASCALPGVMKPAKLMAKDADGKQVLFEVDGVEWIDGSVQADLPFKRISTLFNVSNFIVCQCNFHVVPLLNKAHHPGTQSFYWRLFQIFEWDIRSRVLNLSRLGLFPRFFGQDVSKVFKQKYHGNITLVPKFTMMQVFGLKSLVNPSVEDMIIYIQNGQMAAWPYMEVMKHMLRLERSIDSCLFRLQDKLHSLPVDVQLEELSRTSDSISASSRFGTDCMHLLTFGKEKEQLLAKVKRLEEENSKLKEKLEKLEVATNSS